MSKIFIVFFDFHGSNLKKIRLRRGACAAGAPARRAILRGRHAYAASDPDMILILIKSPDVMHVTVLLNIKI